MVYLIESPFKIQNFKNSCLYFKAFRPSLPCRLFVYFVMKLHWKRPFACCCFFGPDCLGAVRIGSRASDGPWRRKRSRWWPAADSSGPALWSAPQTWDRLCPDVRETDSRPESPLSGPLCCCPYLYMYIQRMKYNQTGKEI